MARIVIVGGGIGGLAAALSITQRGHQALVLERSRRFAEMGAGIQIAPNGVHALGRLGLGDAVAAAGVHIDELRFMDGTDGRHVASMPLTGRYRRRFGNPYVVVHRGELYRMLVEACRAEPAVTLRAGREVVGYRQDSESASALLRSGTEIRGDAVVGADGLHSAVRGQLVADGPPTPAGITVFRTIVPMERVPEELRRNAVTWWAGPGRHFVHYAIAGGAYLNLAPSVENSTTRDIAGESVEADEVRGAFSAFAETPRRLLALGSEWRSWSLVDRDPVGRWSDGRVVLLGDAAHPMLHYAAQGACQALEDAVVLGGMLDVPPARFAAAFEGFGAARRERTAAITRAARASTKLWHPAGEAARARNAALSSLSAEEMHDYVAWMHGALVGGPHQRTYSGSGMGSANGH
ncbi:FAD-dependent monooxygenase [Nocardiopsis coralliicola]